MFGLEKIVNKVEIPPSEVDADLAIPAFNLDKNKIIEEIKKLGAFDEPKIVGQYINIKLNTRGENRIVADLIRHLNEDGEEFGFNNDGNGQKIIIEYSGPNIAKPMHMGHARNNAIGHALVNIYKANGYEVTTTNHLGDWGMSLAKIMLAYQKWGDEKEFEKDAIRHLLDLYIRITKELETNPELENEARILFKKLEDGDKKLRELWQKFRDVSMENFKRVYEMLGISFDIWNGESFYEPYINEVIQEALDKKVATREAGGPTAVNLDQFKLPSYLLCKSDGASLYSARDLAVGKWRLKEYNPDKILYVVGHEQELYLKQIFKTLGLMGYPEEKFEHISYGLVTLNNKKISTRSGNIIFLEDGLKEAIKRAKGIKEVGIGAVVYNMLFQSREKDIAFDWEKILNLQGNSAPYIQYGYVRAKSILEKARELKKTDHIIISEKEIKLVVLISYYPYIVKQARQLNSPHLIATFLNNFVQEFNRFYTNSPVISAENDLVKNSRLLLTKSVAQVIKNGLWLLGIQAPEKM
ncbi:MAG: arginine--tRNA ligase [Patescibacteria group bacterium]